MLVYLSCNYSNKQFRVTYGSACITEIIKPPTESWSLLTLSFRVITVSRGLHLKGNVFALGDAITDASHRLNSMQPDFLIQQQQR